MRIFFLYKHRALRDGSFRILLRPAIRVVNPDFAADSRTRVASLFALDDWSSVTIGRFLRRFAKHRKLVYLRKARRKEKKTV